MSSCWHCRRHRDKQLAGYAYVQMPIDPLLQVFRQQSLSSVRIDLRQGDGRGDLLLDSIGSTDVSTLNYPGDPIADSMFRIASAQVELPILVSRKLWVVLTLAIGSLAIGLFLFYARKVGWARVRKLFDLRKITPAPVLAQVSAQAPSLAAKVATLQAKAAAPGKDAADRDTFVDRSIFRAYDIRGVVGKTLNDGVARLIGHAIGSVMRESGPAGNRRRPRRPAVRSGTGRRADRRPAQRRSRRHRHRRCADAGGVFRHLPAATPAAASMVTGSHNPPDYNGFKIVVGGETLSGDAIQNLYARIVENRLYSRRPRQPAARDDRAHDYIERIAGDVQIERKLKVVVDCGNGIAGAIAPDVLEAIGCEVAPLFCEVDGNFPNHHPDPCDPHNLQDLIRVGEATEGRHRPGVRRRRRPPRRGHASGEIIYPDRLLMLFAHDVLARNPGATIIYDVKCTGQLQPIDPAGRRQSADVEDRAFADQGQDARNRCRTGRRDERPLLLHGTLVRLRRWHLRRGAPAGNSRRATSRADRRRRSSTTLPKGVSARRN